MSAALVILDNVADHARAAALATELGLPLRDAVGDDCIAALRYADNRLELLPADARQSGPVCVDFCTGPNAHRLQGGAELIVKAVRGRSKDQLSVLDATAGLGRDSWVLASRGICVRMLERSPIVAALLADGLARARDCGDENLVAIANRLSLQQADAMLYLQQLHEAQRPDVIYLDPMFPPSDKSALVKKEMRLFQQLFHGADQDYGALLAAARQCARVRVIVKRPRKSEALAQVAPDYSLEGKSVRFDVYIARG